MKYELKSVNKSVTEKYDFRFDKAGYAIVFLDEVSGLITMNTDWGNFSYGWPSPGRGTGTLKEFLASCDTGYLLDKFCRRNWFDEDGTKEALKELVKQEILVDEVRTECLQEIKDADFHSVDHVYTSFQDQCPTMYEEIFKFDMYGLPASNDYCPCERGFFEEIWPLIKNELMTR